MIFSKICTVTGELYSVEVNPDAFLKWEAGALIQDVMPELTADQREFLISNCTPAEFSALFGEEE